MNKPCTYQFVIAKNVMHLETGHISVYRVNVCYSGVLRSVLVDALATACLMVHDEAVICVCFLNTQ